MARQGSVPGSFIGRASYARFSRAPMFDVRFNEFCLSLPIGQQIRHSWDRRRLREAVRGMLPEDVRLRVTRAFPQPAFQGQSPAMPAFCARS